MEFECVSSENIPLEQQVVDLLKKHQMTLTTAESCTGGLLAGTLINVSGASDVFSEGYITYANASKQKILGVKASTLEQYGAVSEQCAKEMALGAVRAADAAASLVTTGIAGPGGGTDEKPVGLVYIGCCIKERVWVESYQMQGDRQNVRNQSVSQALKMFIRCLSVYDEK